METENSLRVLVSPLDWGLGHATRCIPIIKDLQSAGCTVYVACDETARSLLSPEFPDVRFLLLPGYGIRYASSKRWFAFKILQQIPKIITAIRREHGWLKKAVVEYKINLVISDNRYGLYHATVPCIFITHQLSIQTPFRPLSRFVQRLSYRYINRYCECWVPDFETAPNIAGALSHPQKMPRIPVKYVGILSRFQQPEIETVQYEWLMMMSGPEPQRTLLEKELLKVIPSLKGNVLLIRGLPNTTSALPVPVNCTVFNHLSTKDLQTAFAQSEYIISRSGYTTVMELIALGKKSILIPTPGQTEQEYLARHLAKQQWCIVCKKLGGIAGCLQAAPHFTYALPRVGAISVQEAVDERIKRLVMNR